MFEFCNNIWVIIISIILFIIIIKKIYKLINNKEDKMNKKKDLNVLESHLPTILSYHFGML
jgi:hypothetical protein